jgi:alpha-amylase
MSKGTVVEQWWDNGDKQIAFCRGQKGFIVFNDQYNTDLNVNLQVNLTTKSSLIHEFC